MHQSHKLMRFINCAIFHHSMLTRGLTCMLIFFLSRMTITAMLREQRFKAFRGRSNLQVTNAIQAQLNPANHANINQSLNLSTYG